MRVDARPKISAALLLVEKDLRKKETVSTTGSTAISSATLKGTTKKEAVSLPKFSGTEKPGSSPFLEYPMWLRNWNQPIMDYEEKSRCNMLLSHLDKDAQRRIIGSENDYLAAMKKLHDYFGNKQKVIRDCTNEINNFPKVQLNDFKKLVELKTCIEINYACLASLKLQAEMSNTQSMKGLEASAASGVD